MSYWEWPGGSNITDDSAVAMEGSFQRRTRAIHRARKVAVTNHEIISRKSKRVWDDESSSTDLSVKAAYGVVGALCARESDGSRNLMWLILI
jgi:hypothetical protein